jgi:hypothetical protein
VRGSGSERDLEDSVDDGPQEDAGDEPEHDDGDMEPSLGALDGRDSQIGGVNGDYLDREFDVVPALARPRLPCARPRRPTA